MATQSKFFADIGLETGQDLLVDGNATVTGNLTVNGTQTTVNSTTTSVADSMIELANSNTSSDTLDIGIYGNYNDGLADGVGEFTGLFRDASDSTWKLFDGLEVEPTTTVNTSGTNYAKAALEVGDLSCTTLTATNSLTGASLTYPTSDGTNGQVLTTNGSGTLSFTDMSSGADGITASGSNTIIQSPDDTNVIHVNNSADVGIGQSSPNAKLDVVMTGAGDIAKFTGTSITDFDIIGNPPEFNLEDSGSTSGQKRARITLNDNALKIQGLSDDDTALTHDFLTCDLSNGSIGINESSPSFTTFGSNGGGLEIDDVGSSFSALRVNHGTGDAYFAVNAGATYLWQYSNSPIVFGTNNSEYERVDEGGTKFHMTTSGYGTTNYARHWIQFASGSQRGFAFKATSTTSTDTPMIFFNGGAGVAGSITYDYNGTSYNTTSDYRLKENVSDTWDATTRLKQLRPVRFNWIADDTNTLIDGFLAHEVADVVPNAVTGDKDAIEPQVLYTETDYDVINGTANVGEVKDAERIEPQTLDNSKLVPLLVKTIQELEARITTLESA